MWIVEGRAPSFATSSDASLAPYVSFGTSLSYLWGNIAAIDCLNIPENEQKSSTRQDFKLCFAGMSCVPELSILSVFTRSLQASGDLRNVISTINGLPEDYKGKCDILCNDWDSRVVGRNLVILHALLISGIPVEEAAELALHLMYSPFITKAASSFLNRSISYIHSMPLSDKLSTDLESQGMLHVVSRPDSFDSIIEMIHSSYGMKAALLGYQHIMLNAERQDYRDRFMSAALQPCHRLAFVRYRKQGVLAPFSLDVTHFTEPKR